MALINLSLKTGYRSLEIFKDFTFGRRGALVSKILSRWLSLNWDLENWNYCIV